MLLTKNQKLKILTSILLSAIFFSVSGFDFDDAEKAFRGGRCRKAVSIGTEVIQNSYHAPEKIKEDRMEKLDKWQQALRDCKKMLPEDYESKIDEFNKEFEEIIVMENTAVKTDDACELLRRVTVFTNDVKYTLAECQCLDYSKDLEKLVRKVMVLCPKPCKEAETEIKILVDDLNNIKRDIKISTGLLKSRRIKSFRKKIVKYKERVTKNGEKATEMLTTMDFCLGRKSNRELGFISGNTESLVQGLDNIDQMCSFIQSLHRKIRLQQKRNKSFRDSVGDFFSQVNNVIDKWVLTSTAGDRAKNMAMQKSTDQQMHDMIYKLAKVDLKRSLFLLDSPTEEKKREIARLQTLTFEGQLSKEEISELNELRNKVSQKLFLSIPWTVRLWDHQRGVAITILVVASVSIIGLIIGLFFLIKGRNSSPAKKAEEEVEEESSDDDSVI